MRTLPALDLQGAVHDALRADPAVRDLIGGRVFDRVPANPSFPYVTIGDDEIYPESEGCSIVTECFVTVHVWARDVGKPSVKRLAEAVQRALDAPLAFKDERFVIIDHSVRDIKFMRDRDGLTEHGVIVMRYLIEAL